MSMTSDLASHTPNYRHWVLCLERGPVKNRLLRIVNKFCVTTLSIQSGRLMMLRQVCGAQHIRLRQVLGPYEAEP